MTTEASSQLPAWFDEVITTFMAGVAHGFILSGDVLGRDHPGHLTAALPQQVLVDARREVVAYYSRACGITFPLASMREKAERMLATGNAPAADPNPLNAVLDQAGIGVQPTGDQFSAARRPLDALALLERLLRAPEGRGRVAVILDFADFLSPAQEKFLMSQEDRLLLVTLLWWGQDEAMAACGNPIFLLSRNGAEVHEDLRSSGSGYKLIEIPLPSREERLTYLSWYLQPAARAPEAHSTERGHDRWRTGQPHRRADPAAPGGHPPARCQSRWRDRLLVKARKDAIIKGEFSDIAEMIEPLPGGFNSVGGMERLISPG